LEQVNR